MYICSFDSDEPVREVLAAAHLIDPETTLYITGNSKKMDKSLSSNLASNVKFTGYLEEIEYVQMLQSCDAIVTLTKNPNTMQCGAYEAVAVGTPLVIGPDRAMVDYFSRGRVVAEISPEGVATAISRAVLEKESLSADISELLLVRSGQWDKVFENLLNIVKRATGVYGDLNPTALKK